MSDAPLSEQMRDWDRLNRPSDSRSYADAVAKLEAERDALVSDLATEIRNAQRESGRAHTAETCAERRRNEANRQANRATLAERENAALRKAIEGSRVPDGCPEQGGGIAAAQPTANLMTYRTGDKLGTTVYRGERTDDQQPVAMVFNLPVDEARRLAAAIADFLGGVGIYTLRPKESADTVRDAAPEERERCARVAEGLKTVNEGSLRGPGWNEAAAIPAAAIRKGP